jgi:hypothetical protein
MPYSDRTVNRAPSEPLLARLVVIEMTPDAAREPYSVDAAAPFTTSTLSMSAGLMSAMLEPRTMPSTM